MTTKTKRPAEARGIAFKAELAEDLRDPAAREAFATRRRIHEIARTVRAMREQAGLSQLQLAELIGAKQPSIARLETSATHTPQWKLLERIALVLGKQLRLVFDDPDDARPVVEVKGRKARAQREPNRDDAPVAP